MGKHATAIWNGTGKEGTGNITLQSNLLDHVKYSYQSRYEDGPGTNPEELVAAAHASCFTLKLSFILNAAGFTADELETTCDITLADGAITKSHLTLKAKVPGISQEKFDECAKDAKENCPISKLLNTNISLEASLV
ncbi:MAG: OsmC family protein [Chitinophagaceae bacterium]